MAYFWAEGGDIHFSQDMVAWIKMIYEEYQNLISDNVSQPSSAQDFLRELVGVLYDANDIYGRIYCFSTAFYDLFARWNDVKAWAVVHQLRNLVESDREAGLKTNKAYTAWDYGEHATIFQPGRLKVKRYLALLGNKDLRMRIFGF